MSGDKRAVLKQWLESGQVRLEPLSFPQRELWEASPVPVANMANHICCLIEVGGKVTPEDGKGALERVHERQEALRISFLPGKDSPLQMVRREGTPNFRFRELSAGESRPEAVEEIAREIFSEPFDLLQGPLYRAELLRRAPNDHVMVFAVHHAIADGWSLGIFVQELCMAYIQQVRGNREALPALPQSYTAWSAAERAFWQPSELESRGSFWRSHLAGAPRLWRNLEGPATAAGPHQRLVELFPAALAGSARELARRSGATLFSTLLAVFQVALARWTGVDDILVGTPVANRTKVSAKETMGYFAGVVPLRCRLEAQRSFSASLRDTHQTTVDCFAHAMPFAELVRAVGEQGAPGHTPVFEVRFALQNHPIPDVALPGLSAKLRMRSTGTARFHLGCEITEIGDELEVVWLFRPALFPKSEVERLGRFFAGVLRQACAAPETRIIDFNCEL